MPVKLGTSASVAAVPGGEIRLLVEKAQRGSITTEITLEESVTAPVSRGQRLGTLTVRAGEQTLTQVPLVAGDTVGRLTMGRIALEILRTAAMSRN